MTSRRTRSRTKDIAAALHYNQKPFLSHRQNIGIMFMLLRFSYIMPRRGPGSRRSDEEEIWVRSKSGHCSWRCV